ncbi:nitrate- and nitrite sensing domain-containing protein [Nocardiopsis dassonvillei]|uniref:sensor histidine kinase n=1 Tax=Nocardiopsis dassonvillei TaxID=2014 RepID=UPI0036FE882B
MPHNKRRSLRARMITLVLFPSTVLLALWAAFTALLVGDIGELRTTATFTEQVGVPVEETISALQRERRATMDAAWGTERTALYLTYSRQRTDEAVDALSRSLDAFDVQDLPEQALTFRAAVNRVDTLRARVDASSPTEIDLEETSTVYDEVIEQGLRVWDGQVERADPAQAPHLRSLTSLMRTRELLNQQDTVLAHAVATNSFPVQAHAQFAAAAGAQHYTWDRVVVEMSEEDGQDYIELESYTEVQRIYQLQESIISMPVRGGATVPVNATAWQGAAEAVDARMRDVEQGQIDRVIAFSRSQSAELRTSVLLVSVPALVAALVSSAVAVGATQRLGRRLQDLRTATLEHARVRLPEVTARLRAGGSVDVDAEVPRLRVESTDEVGQVAEAFNDAQRAAVAAAVEEAQVRAGVRNMFRNIARRTQALVHRQLGLLDALERAETDPKVLESLFRIDHFSTQMRRNAENLMLLSGDAPVRRGLAPVRLHEAVRAAASEIEDYVRVRVLAVPAVALRGEVGADTVRLLAELLENATSFSPPGTEVTVRGRAGEAGGCVLEVLDRGLGMTREQLEASNALLRDPPRFDLARMREDSQLGLFVVATIAARHGLEVTLSAGPERGTCAVVAVPADALADQDTGAAEPGPDRDAATARSQRLVLAGGSPAAPGGAEERAARESGGRAVPETADAAVDEDTGDTYKGLPRRRRKGVQPSPAPAPAAPGHPGESGGREAAAERSLTEIRSMMSAFQSGSLRGRAQPPDGDGDGVRGARPGESSEG